MGPVASHEAVLDAERRGELLMAFDLAERGLAERPDDLWLKHRAVLALARTGSTGDAERRFTEYGLAGVGDEDVAALEARIAKDKAIAAGGRLRPRRGPLRGDLPPHAWLLPGGQRGNAVHARRADRARGGAGTGGAGRA